MSFATGSGSDGENGVVRGSPAFAEPDRERGFRCDCRRIDRSAGEVSERRTGPAGRCGGRDGTAALTLCERQWRPTVDAAPARPPSPTPASRCALCSESRDRREAGEREVCGLVRLLSNDRLSVCHSHVRLLSVASVRPCQTPHACTRVHVSCDCALRGCRSSSDGDALSGGSGGDSGADGCRPRPLDEGLWKSSARRARRMEAGDGRRAIENLRPGVAEPPCRPRSVGDTPPAVCVAAGALTPPSSSPDGSEPSMGSPALGPRSIESDIGGPRMPDKLSRRGISCSLSTCGAGDAPLSHRPDGTSVTEEWGGPDATWSNWHSRDWLL